MKTLLVILCVGLLQTLSVIAADKNESFTVYGNCGMCKKTIEKAVKKIEGISEAVWNKKTKIITVTFDDARTSLEAIKKSIAESGYDTDEIRATDEAYSTLHTCCRYDRPVKK